MDKPQRKTKFKTLGSNEPIPADPESLFRDLRSRAPDIKHLWSHQADVLRAYDKDEFREARDVALELPTGAGKTLLGLLIAEYRRRKFHERVVYLCPTRQLVHQVKKHADRYGIKTSALLAKEYEGLNDYRLGHTIGITVYSSLFNASPRINDPNVIILDDAHSAENYITSLWSVSINRQEQEELYREILYLFEPALETSLFDSMIETQGAPDTYDKVDLIPIPRLWRFVSAFSNLLDSKFQNTDHRFSWSKIKGSLHACCLYISWSELLLRPVIPPTMTHKPFNDAKQRIYMSATLGESGELERIAGVRDIKHLPMPEGWDRQSSGRRLFLFPNISSNHSDDEIETLIINAVKQSDRALILTPRTTDVLRITKRFAQNKIDVLGAKNIEESLDSFKKHKNVVLVLANRYDGIDLPGDECRLLILDGLPVGVNLQERFLFSKLKTNALFREQVRTRFVQGTGRCCRDSTDYAVVLIVEQHLFDFCARSEERAGMHPEIQAEIEFGIENSKGSSSEDFLELMKLLNDQGEDWIEADHDIQERRAKAQKSTDPTAEVLRKAARNEVDFVYSLWKKDYDSALQKATSISDMLRGDEMKGYRGWWYYLAGCVAWLDGTTHNNKAMMDRSRDLFERAAKCAEAVDWLATLSKDVSLVSTKKPKTAEDKGACSAIYQVIKKLGVSGSKFEDNLTKLKEFLGQNEATSFEQGLKMFGEFLGLDSRKPEGKGVPDGVWVLPELCIVVFEAKSYATSDDISIATVRQANTHPEWVRNKVNPSPTTEIVTVVISPQKKIDQDAWIYAQDTYFIHIDKLRYLAEKLMSVLRRIRTVINLGDESVSIELIYDEFYRAELLPKHILGILKQQTLKDLEVVQK